MMQKGFQKIRASFYCANRQLCELTIKKQLKIVSEVNMTSP
jgi:hypothetical protein